VPDDGGSLSAVADSLVAALQGAAPADAAASAVAGRGASSCGEAGSPASASSLSFSSPPLNNGALLVHPRTYYQSLRPQGQPLQGGLQGGGGGALLDVMTSPRVPAPAAADLDGDERPSQPPPLSDGADVRLSLSLGQQRGWRQLLTVRGDGLADPGEWRLVFEWSG